MENNKLNVSEMFYSIQGEGKTMGIPSVFLRLQACNLLCNWKKDGIDHYCDTVEVWKKGKPISFEDIIHGWNMEGWLEKLLIKGAHLIITGGEPMLQQKAIAKFCEDLRNLTKNKIFIEIETNGTIKPSIELEYQIDLFNTSPKLSNSTMQLNKRYKEEVLQWHVRNNENKGKTIDGRTSESIFKFVVNNIIDLNEIENDFVNKFNISPNRVWLMPEGANREELNEKRQMVAEMCKQNGYNFSDRLQVVIWDRVTGV